MKKFFLVTSLVLLLGSLGCWAGNEPNKTTSSDGNEVVQLEFLDKFQVACGREIPKERASDSVYMGEKAYQCFEENSYQLASDYSKRAIAIDPFDYGSYWVAAMSKARLGHCEDAMDTLSDYDELMLELNQDLPSDAENIVDPLRNEMKTEIQRCQDTVQ